MSRKHVHHDSLRNIKTATLLNFGFTLIEFIGGALTNSLAIMADALHDLGDTAILFTSWKVEQAAHRRPDWKRSFGYRRLSLLAAFLNAVILVGGSLIILIQAVGRLFNVQPVHAQGMIGLAIFGITINLLASLRLHKGESLNEKILSWHLLEDVLGWAAILASAIIIHFFQIYIIDPIITLIFSAFILWGVWRNSKELFNIFLEGVPAQKDLAAIINAIEQINGIKKVYDAHLWSLDGHHNIFTVEAVIAGGLEKQQRIKREIEKILEAQKITHSTIELNQRPDKKEQEQEFLGKRST